MVTESMKDVAAIVLVEVDLHPQIMLHRRL